MNGIRVARGVGRVLFRRPSVSRLDFIVLICLILTPCWASAADCELYPIALSQQSLSGVAPGSVLTNIANGAQPGNFGWLTWAGSPSVPTLVKSLTPPGDSDTYVNPDDPSDHVISIGDWIQGKPGVSNSKQVRNALDALKQIDIVVPVWDETRGQGNNADYRVSSFARVRLISYALPGQNRITARFLGIEPCGQVNQPPLVDAGPDQTVDFPDPVLLDGTATDDGLPSTNALTTTWSQVSGTGTVAFGDANAVDTTASFSAPGLYVLRLTASDSLLPASDDVTITVNQPNRPPEAFDQSLTSPEDAPLAITLQGADPDDDPLEFFVETQPAHGELQGAPPELTYTPTNDYHGEDSFTFKANDGQLDSPPAIVHLSITPVNDAPVAEDVAITNLEDVAVWVQMSGADVDGDAVTYEIAETPLFGTLGGLSSNTVLYTPFPDNYGADRFFYRVSDGALYSRTATVSIVTLPVNDPPVAAPQAVSTDEDAPLPITLAGSDVDGDALAFTITDVPTNGSLSGTPPSLIYTPTANFNGQDSLAFVVSDASVTSAPAVVQISVLPVNDAPVALTQSLNTDEDTPLPIMLTGSDIDGDALSYMVADPPTNGILTGTAPDLLYTPYPNINGSDSFTFLVSDLSVTSAAALIEIAVAPVNDAPIANPQAVSTDEDTPLAVILTGSDVDGDPLTFSLVDLPEHGALDGVPPNLIYTPAADFNGEDLISFTVFDASAASAPAMVQITVLPVNDPPAADAGPDQLTDLPLADAVPLSGTASDIDSASLTTTWSLVSGPFSVTFADEHSLVTTAAFGGPGMYTLQLTVDDGQYAVTDDVIITINAPPAVSAGEDTVIEFPNAAGLSGSVTDDGVPEGVPLQVAWNQVSGPGVVIFSNGTSAAATARFPQIGDYVLRLSATDSRLLGSDEVTVSVRPAGANQAPVVEAGSDQTIGLTSETTLEGSFSDDGLPWGAAVGCQWAQVSGPGAAAFSDPNSAASPVTFDQPGEYVLRLTASDGDLSAADDITITVYPANLPPQVNAGPDQTVSTRSAQVQGQVGDDGRPSGSLTIAWSQVSGPGAATVGNPASGITTVAFALAGEYVLRLTASDGDLTASDDVAIVVTGNRPPTVDAGPDQILDLTVIPESLSTNYFLPRTELPEQWLYDLAQPGMTGMPYGSSSIYIMRNGLAAGGHNVYAAGIYLYANSIEARGLARWDGCAWEPMCDPWLIQSTNDNCGFIRRDGGSSGLSAAAAHEEDLFVAGGFLKDMNGDGAGESTARWTDGQWTFWQYKRVSSGHSAADVWDIEATSNAVYVGGLFSYQPLDEAAYPGPAVPGYPIAHRIVKWTEGGGWEAMGQGIVDTNGVDNGGVAAIKEGPNGEVFVGGTFLLATSNGVAKNIAKWNGFSWETMGSCVGFSDARVNAFAIGPDGALYVGGYFTNAGGVAARNIAKASWNPDTQVWTWSSLGQGVSNGLNNRVEALAFRGSNLYVGGSFSQAGNKTAWRLAKWDGSSWSHVGPDPLAMYGGGNVLALCNADDGLYIGGGFSSVAGQPAGRIVKWGVRKSPTLELPDPVIIRGSPPAGSEIVLTARPGHPCGIPLTVTWNVDGGAAEFTTNLAAGTTAPNVALPFSYFYEPGYHQVTITVEDGLTPPVAGVTTVIVLTPAMTVLNGVVTDDGLPASVTNSQWTVVDGPGAVGFGNSSSPVTSASFDEPGAYLLRLTADDTEYASSDEVTILVRAVGTENQPPAVSAGWDQVITFGETAGLNGVISDDGLPSGSLTAGWSLVSGPGTVTFGNSAEAVTTAAFSEPGTYGLRLTGSDSALDSFDDVTITVNPDLNQPPSVDAGDDHVVMFPEGEPLAFAPLNSTVSDDGLPWGIVNEQWSVVDGPGSALFRYRDGSYSATFNTPGTYVLRLTASDGRLEAFDDVTVSVLAYVPPPVVEIVAPTNTQQVTAPIPVVGTAQSTVLASWTLQQRIVPVAASVSEWTTIATGVGSISASELGSLDPTLALNGTYELRIIASDLAGRTATSEVVNVVFDKNMKVGLFTLSFEDLSVPLAGIPIQVIRTYDSRNAMAGIKGDFGIGWTLSLKDIRLQKNRPIGERWFQEITGFAGGLGIPIYGMSPRRDRIITVTLPDNQVHRFRAVFNPTPQTAIPIVAGTVVFEPLPGTYGSLEAADGTTVRVVGDVPYYDPFGGPSRFSGYVDIVDDLGEDYDPQLFRFTTQDGTAYLIHEEEGLVSVTDLNGNQVQYTQAGIFHSSGESVQFIRDGEGRVTQILDPTGKALNYGYDTNGNLQVFTDRGTNSTIYAYISNPAAPADPPHLLQDIFDPRGVRAVRSEYDSDGRLIRQVDADGNPIEFGHDVENRRETVTDRLGHVTIHEYDDRGNVVKTIDALTNVTLRVYDDLDNEILAVDALGHENTATWDNKGNKLTETDALGNTTRYTYNSFGQPLTITDARTNQTRFTYDVYGNLRTETDALGHVATYTYDDYGNLLTRADALGNVMENAYDIRGRLTNAVVRDAAGTLLSLTRHTYDRNGNQLTQTKVDPGSGVEFPVSNSYDGNNRLIATVHPDGSITRVEYNAIGKEAVRIDALRRETFYEYDDRGNLILTTYPDETTESTEYDEEGRKVSSADRLGRPTDYIYDALGRLTDTVYPDGATGSSVYDALGRVITTVDARGNETHYEYEDCSCGGRQARVIDALGNVTEYEYDANGNRTAMTDANGHRMDITYDALNRPIHRAVAGVGDPGITTTYDALGRRIAETDQAGLTTQYRYDGLGRLTNVVDALNQVTSYGYDGLGNLISQTDANGHTTLFEYDSMGRRIKRTLPEGQIETYAYDFSGNMTNKVDFNGKVTAYEYDDLNRLTGKLPDASFAASNVLFTYSAMGQRLSMSDQSGVTTYQYDDRDRLTEKATPQGTLSYTYDLHGNLTGIQSSNSNGVYLAYTYDDLNRLKTVNDHRAGLTMYNYDDVGNLQDFILPNGVSQVYAYDALNRLTNVAVNRLTTQIESYSYTLGPSGHRLVAQEGNGRRVTYQYDNIYRLTRETILGASPLGDISYTLDPMGNRISMNSTILGIPSQVNTFDENDRLGSDTYDAGGNTTAATIHDSLSGTDTAFTCSYDFENRILSATSVLSVVQLLYDGDGNRVQKIVTDAFGTRTTRYLVDERNPTRYSQVIEELDADNNVTASYATGLDVISLTLATPTNKVTHFFGYDGHGNVRFLTDADGLITDRWDYDAYGNLIARSGTTPNNILYCGEQFDSDLGRYFLRARYMDMTRGRFWSMDAWEGARLESSGLHKYLYCEAEPVNGVDPSGQTTLTDLSIASNESVEEDRRQAAQARQKYKQAKRMLCTGSYGIGVITHHILPVFAGPMRSGSSANLGVIRSSQWHIQLHQLVGRALALAGLPYPNISQDAFVDILQDPMMRRGFIAAMRVAYTEWDKRCVPPAPSLLNHFNRLVNTERWETL